jgi:hypothetical protein
VRRTGFSTLAVVSTVAGASADRVPVLIAGIATGLAGVFSMAAGEYMSSKSQREIFVAQIAGEREEVADRPGEAEAEMAYMLEEDGLPRETAMTSAIAAPAAQTMVEKELGPPASTGDPFQGAGDGHQLQPGAAVPVLAYLVLPIGTATWAAVGERRRAVEIGVLKSLDAQDWLRSAWRSCCWAPSRGGGFLFGNCSVLLGDRSRNLADLR